MTSRGAGATWRYLGLIALAMASAAAFAHEVPDTLAQRIKACTACHGEKGEGGANGYNPRIGGKPELYLFRQLLNFREGRRNYPLMEHMVRPLDDDYLAEIAHFFATQSPPPLPPERSRAGVALRARGELLVRHGDPAKRIPACAACHGAALAGVAPTVPALIGLGSDYVSAQLGAWRAGTRGAPAPDCMAEIARNLDAADIAAVAGWLAAQPVLAGMHAAQELPAPPPLECGSMAP